MEYTTVGVFYSVNCHATLARAKYSLLKTLQSYILRGWEVFSLLPDEALTQEEAYGATNYDNRYSTTTSQRD